MSVGTRKCPYCNGRTLKETSDIPDSCYCSKCGSYLQIDYRGYTKSKITLKGLIARDRRLAFNPSRRSDKI